MKFLNAFMLPGLALGAVAPTILPGSEMESTLSNLVRRGPCHANNCARAVTGVNGKPAVTARQSDCSSFMRHTVVLPTNTVTATVWATVTEAPVLNRRQQTIIPNQVPTYASACADANAYASACSCWGITATTTTVPGPTVTATVTSTTTVPAPIQTLTGILKVSDSSNNNVLGYVGKTYLPPAYMLIQGSADPANALVVTIKVPTVVASISSAELTMTNSNHPHPFLGLVQGRDSTSADEQPGSFNYLYLSATEHTPVGSVPLLVGTTYNDNTGLSKLSESSVWSFNVATKQLAPAWINTDGNPAVNLQLFTQSNGLYAGSDPDAFHTRFPAPVTRITFTLVLV
ncbi:hypothetical protein PT974_04666 [Cladobotryum mycophilum]|uniref:Uncharacterized protein n=1 Tax=Cladobotryum mycophilum TaxID=491253 RepID=A0ABR0SVU2_9HYPO